MADNYQTRSCCIVDNGIFSELATTLASSFGKIYYTAPWISAFPSARQLEIGEGFPEFEHVDDIWGIVDDVDLFVFPDIFQGPLQGYLADKGKRVFGSRNGDELENYRSEAKAHFEELGIPQGPYEVIKGMAALRRYIQSRGEDKLWIKINLTRGDTETFPIESYDLGKNRLDKLEAALGPVADQKEFIVEDNLVDTVDIAIDTYSIDGKYPTKTLLGTEEKGEAYVCAVKDWSKLPANLVDIYEKLSPTLAKYEYRNFLSLECRCRNKKIWLGDPCARAGSPPFELQLNMLLNLPDILWEGAEGKVVEPEYAAKYGFELIVHSDWADENPLLIDFPEQYRDQIKLRYSTQFGKHTWIMPQHGGPRVAAIVSCGDDLEACFDEATEISKTLRGNKIETFTRSIPQLEKNLATLREWGIML
jgi:hypothetical protein